MGELVRFDKEGRVIPEQSSQKTKGQVLMFTGIRYERMPETDIDNNNSGTNPTQKRG